MSGRTWILLILNVVLLSVLGGRFYWRSLTSQQDRLTLVRAGFEHHPVLVEQLGPIEAIEPGEGTPPLDGERFLDMYKIRGEDANAALWLEVETDEGDQLVGILDSMLVLRDGTRLRVKPRLPDGGGSGSKPFERAPPPVNAIPKALRRARRGQHRVVLALCLDRSLPCRRLASVLTRDQRIRTLIQDRFEVVLVDVAGDANRVVLRRYGRAVRRQGTPMLVLLSRTGAVSAFRGPRTLLEGDYPDVDAIRGLLRSWGGSKSRARRSAPSAPRQNKKRPQKKSEPAGYRFR